MADDIDTSDMPEPSAIGLDAAKQADPAADMPTPADLFEKAYGYRSNSQMDIDGFMKNPPQPETWADTASRATGLPRAAAGAVAGVGAGVASLATHAVGGTLGLVAGAAHPEKLADLEDQTNKKAREWAEKISKLADYVPATELGARSAEGLLGAPGAAIKDVSDTLLKPHMSENAYTTLGEVGQDIGTDLQAFGAKGVLKGAAKVVKPAVTAAKAVGRGVADAVSTDFKPSDKVEPLKPDVDPPVSAESLRAAPNPIPPPEGTVARARQAAATPPAADTVIGNQPQDMSLTPQERAAERARVATERAKQIGLTGELEPEPVPANAAASEGAAARRDAMTDEERTVYDRANRIPTTGETAEQLQARLNTEADARGKTLGSRDQAPPAAAGTTSPGNTQRGSVRLFDPKPPAAEGPQETPTPAKQGERQAHLDALDKLSSGGLPTRRSSALTGDYNATGDDFQMKEVGHEGMRQQIASENDALHAGMENVHQSVGSDFGNSVDSQTLGDRGRVTRGAIQAIQKHFEDATDAVYDTAREQNKGKPIPKLQRVSDYLNDDSNFTNDAEIGLQRAAKQRMDRLWSSGDPDKGAPPGSVNAAERLREFLNEKGKNPNAMGVAKDLKDHLDMDVAEHGGPGLFDAARKMRRHQYQMLEEPTGIKKLLTPGDSQGINHAIPEHKVMDYIADLPRDQHEHVMNALRAGAHLDPDVAKASAAAVREIQGHAISRIHAAATNADGTWNARKFYNAADRYGRNAPETFKDKPDVLKNLQTLSDAGNTLNMDKHYPGAAAQTERTGALGHVLETGGIAASSLAHEIPLAGRFIGRGIERATENAGNRLKKTARDREVNSRLVDRNGKQRGSVKIMNEEPEEGGSQLNIGLHQGDEGRPGFRKMSKQEASSAVESTGAKVTKSSVLTPEAHGVTEPTMVASTNRPLSEPEMQKVLAKTKQYAIPQRTDTGTESMHIAPGHEDVAKAEGWDKFNPDYFRNHDGSPLSKQRGSVRVMNEEQPRDERNARTEYNANKQLAGNRPRLTPEQEEIIRKLGGGQRGSVRVMNEKPLAGAPEGDRPNGVARAAAAAYAKKAGIDYKPLNEYRYVSPDVAKDVGNAYEEMKHDPTDPKVKKSYDAFKAETLAQYKQMTKAGMKVDLDPSYPYKNPREMHEDVRANNHMSIYPTEAGFGSGEAAASDHPLMEKAPVKMGGKDATYNDLFRAVHDYYGHAAEGNGFRANGEYNAWRAHRQMYSADARGAMDSETLGQNSWVNSGPPAAFNKGASSADTIYADQKAGLLPKNVVKSAEEGVGADEHHITNQLTDSERSQLRTDTTKRLIDAFHSAPATKEYAAAALAGAAKRGWYRNSAQAIVNQFGPDAPRFAGLLSAMSPQVSVQTNFANALKTFVNWDKAGRPEDPGEIRKIMEGSSQKSATAAPGSSNVLDAWVNNSVRALTADDPSNIKLSGPKVHSFYNNLTDNVHEVTNDAWMAAFSKTDPAKLGGGLNNSGPGKSPTYLALSAKVRDAARMISHLTGETWTPAEVQETVWSWAKTAYEHAEEKGSNVSIPDLVKNGDITDELIRSTPDFHQLFGTSEHRGLLQSSSFAKSDAELAHGQSQGASTAGSSKARQAAQEALRPNLISAAERLEQLRQERVSAGRSAPKGDK